MRNLIMMPNGQRYLPIASIILSLMTSLFAYSTASHGTEITPTAETNPRTSAKKKKNVYEDEDIYLRTIYRSPEQIAAFYEGREFPPAAIRRIVQSCYVTIIIKNKMENVLWLELDNWVFKQNRLLGQNLIQRYKRDYWAKQWDEIKLKRAHRSTFGWTLMPDARDLRPEEGVGGSVPIPMQSESFSLQLNFATGKNKRGKIKSVTLSNIYCKQND